MDRGVRHCGAEIVIERRRERGRRAGQTFYERRGCNRPAGHDGPHRVYGSGARVIAEAQP